ncbi:hypothetical protein Mapa_000327 [Marchantia paleacea]|nr:hypothetical protein Mapa_000327 [Marchantia paleacea]
MISDESEGVSKQITSEICHRPNSCQTFSFIRTILRLRCIVGTTCISHYKLLPLIIMLGKHCSQTQHTRISMYLKRTTSYRSPQNRSRCQPSLELNKSSLLFISTTPLLI